MLLSHMFAMPTEVIALTLSRDVANRMARMLAVRSKKVICGEACLERE